MNTDKSKNFPWDTMDTAILLMPEEIIVYHLYRAKIDKKEKGTKDMKLLSSYLARETKEKEDNQRCFQK